MSIVVGTALVLVGIVLAELRHWARGERATSEASYFREAAGSLVHEITQQRQQTEAAMRRAVQQVGRRNDA